METTNRSPYRPQAYLAARRYDPERQRQARADAASVARFLTEECGRGCTVSAPCSIQRCPSVRRPIPIAACASRSNCAP